MEFVIKNTGRVVDYLELRDAFPNNYIPAAPTVEYLGALGVAMVEETFPPAHAAFHNAVRDGVAKVGSVYKMAWKVVAWSAEQIADFVASARESKWAEIKQDRDRRKADGVKVSVDDVGNKWFHSDDASRIQQIALVMMGVNLPAGLQWKTMDGSFVTMTSALAAKVFNAIVVQDQTIFAVAEQHRVLMEAITNPELYDFSTGWPQSFTNA